VVGHVRERVDPVDDELAAVKDACDPRVNVRPPTSALSRSRTRRRGGVPASDRPSNGLSRPGNAVDLELGPPLIPDKRPARGGSVRLKVALVSAVGVVRTKSSADFDFDLSRRPGAAGGGDQPVGAARAEKKSARPEGGDTATRLAGRHARNRLVDICSTPRKAAVRLLTEHRGGSERERPEWPPAVIGNLVQSPTS